MTEAFNVVVYDRAGFWHYTDQNVPAKQASRVAVQLVRMALADPDADISRVLITDADDFTNFLWDRERGFVYPPQRQETRH